VNKNIFKITFLVLGIAFLLFPLFASADGLVPCGGPGEDPCTTCDLLVLLQNIIKFGVKMATFVVIGSVVYGGFRWILSGGNQANIQAGQKAIMSAVIGFIIILSAWLIVNTVFWLIAQAGGDDEYIGTWYKIECEMPSALSPAGDKGSLVNNSGGGNSGSSGGSGGSSSNNTCENITMNGKYYYHCTSPDNCKDITSGGPKNAGQMDCPDGSICCEPQDLDKIVSPNPSSPEIVIPNYSTECQDSDGKDIYTAGYVTYKGRKYEDICVAACKKTEKTMIVEYYCSNQFGGTLSQALSTKNECPSHQCLNGACLPE